MVVVAPPETAVVVDVVRRPGAVTPGAEWIVVLECPELPRAEVVVETEAVVEVPELPDPFDGPRPGFPVEAPPERPGEEERPMAAGTGVVTAPTPRCGGAVLRFGVTTGPMPGRESFGAHGARARLAASRTR